MATGKASIYMQTYQSLSIMTDHYCRVCSHFYNSLLPDVAYNAPALDLRPTDRWEEEITDGDTSLYDNDSPPDIPIMKLPYDVWELIYENILGPVRGTVKSSETQRHVSVARRVVKPHTTLLDDFSSSDDDSNTLYFVQKFDDRGHIMKYIEQDQYYWLESCAQRMLKMGEVVWEDFRDYFFRNTILDLRCEGDPTGSDWSVLEPMASYIWLLYRPEFPPHIRHISLEIDTYHLYNMDMLTGLYRFISRNLDLHSLILWISIPREHVEIIRSCRGELPWPQISHAIRNLVVRDSLEIQVTVEDDARFGPDRHEKVPIRSKEGKELMTEREELRKLLYDILLPNTLRNPIIDDLDDHMGLVELFGEE